MIIQIQNQDGRYMWKLDRKRPGINFKVEKEGRRHESR